MTTAHRRQATAAAGAAAALLLSACGTGPAGGTTAAGADAVTVTNCGAEVTFEQPPERVVLLKSAAVPYLQELGVLDRVVARAGVYPEEYYDDATLAALEKIPLLTDELDTSGHLQISKEVVLAQRPDLVLGEVDNLSRDTLDAVGIPLLEEPALCAEGVEDPGFDDVAAQTEMYARVFDREEAGQQAVAELRERTRQVTEAVGEGTGRTAAVLYPTVGGGTIYAYGTRSMANPQLEAAGLENVFGDVDERVFEVTREELIGRDPDVLVLLHSDGDPAAVKEAITSLPGADGIGAVRGDEVLVQLFNFTEPPTPLSIDGLERIAGRFSS